MTTLTTQQLQTLKAAILADATAAALYTDGNLDGLAQWLNAAAAPAVKVWRTEASVNALLDAISFAQYTPAAAADDTILYLNRVLLSQVKQMNLQLMLQGRESLNCSPPNVRSGLRDATVNVPTGTGGANLSPGGPGGGTVLNVCTRTATRAEALLAAAAQTTGPVSAQVLTFEGSVSYTDLTEL